MLFSSLEILFGRIETESDFPLWTPELLRDRRRPVRPVTPETATPASVLIALLGSNIAEQGPSVILTKRTQDLSTHAGQVSFPGGRAESTDATAEQTAIREASEEIGLDPAAVRVWGRLPDYLTATGFRVSPVIARVDAQATAFERDQREVEEIFHVPLSFLMNPANHQVRLLPAERSPTGELIRFYAMPFRGEALTSPGQIQEFFIWGATASMLRNLYHLLWAAWNQHRGLAFRG